ncbi:MAG: non-canonical purine NTP pyrophosphatase [Acidobacteria bacterium]|nr:non-canonical purine NTP pyrophosphatase [Acidobacteriota bacterium]MBV9474702.1 non-canonical purine NTP pyrophosphatase [Acidobacteriota bacterium]
MAKSAKVSPSSTPAGEQLILVSTNPNKGIEAERILGVPLLRVSIALPEIQAATVEDVTRYKLEVAKTKGYKRLVVEDVALGFDELGHFPGVYVRWLLEAAGGKGLAAIAYALNNRSARAQCCVGYWDGSEVKLFVGETTGEILVQPRGERHFGWDAWFVPEGSKKTFAEMTAEEKDAVSHRGRAYRKLAEHLRASAPSSGRS